MTLLEAIIAFVILSVVGIVCLDQSRGAARLQTSSMEWTRAVAVGESMMAQVVGQAPPDNTSFPTSRETARVERHRWRNGLDEVVVTVPLTSGATYRMVRLVPTINNAVTP